MEACKGCRIQEYTDKEIKRKKPINELWERVGGVLGLV